jgi:MFS family permease
MHHPTVDSTAAPSAAAASPPAAAPVAEPPYPSPARAWYAVGVLTVAYVLSFIDRQILGMMTEAIKRDLGISDTGMSLLLGLSFAVFYTLFGFVVGRLADRANRRNIIAASIFLWSVMTAACGLAKNYGQLFLARMGVGVGEAGLSPAALSMISDSFPRAKLARAIGVYSAGVSAGSGIALLLGALLLPQIMQVGTVTLPLLGEVRPWQAVLVLVGLPGLPIALLALTIREPERRGTLRRDASGAVVSLPLREVAAHLWRHRGTFGGLYFGMSVLTIMAYGVGLWIPPFFIRTYGLPVGEVQHYLILYGLVMLVAGAAGVIAGGWLADRLHRKYADGYLRAVLVGIALLVPGYTLFALMPTPGLAVLLLVPATLGGAIPTAAGAAALMQLAPNQMRAQASALYYFVLSLLGLGIGPTAVALVTDYVFADEAKLRYSIAIVAAVAGVLATGLLWSARRHYRVTLAEADASR